MYSITLEIHSILRYVILIFLVVLIVKHLIGWINQTKFTGFDGIFSTVTVSTIHLQLIVGIVLYFISPLVSFKSHVMQNEIMRYYTVEHLLLMLVAIGLFTAGRVKLKRKDDPTSKHRTGFIYNTSGLLIVIAALAMSSRGII